MDVPVDALPGKEALECCREFLHDGGQHRIATVNPELILEARQNAALRDALQKSDLALVDGVGVALAARWLYGARIERMPGVDFMIDLCALAQGERKSVFFLGGRGGVAEQTAAILQKKFPHLTISGWSENPHEMLQIQHCDILFVALGAPKQELWIAENTKKLPSVKIAMGVGGAFDMLSGKIKRAPRVVRKLGCEWVWRLWQEPRRLGRIFKAVVVFPFFLILRGKQENAPLSMP